MHGNSNLATHPMIHFHVFIKYMYRQMHINVSWNINIKSIWNSSDRSRSLVRGHWRTRTTPCGFMPASWHRLVFEVICFLIYLVFRYTSYYIPHILCWLPDIVSCLRICASWLLTHILLSRKNLKELQWAPCSFRTGCISDIFNDGKVEEEDECQPVRQDGADVALVNGLGCRSKVVLEVAYILLAQWSGDTHICVAQYSVYCAMRIYTEYSNLWPKWVPLIGS